MPSSIDLPRVFSLTSGMAEHARIAMLNAWTRDTSRSLQQIDFLLGGGRGQLRTTPIQYKFYTAKAGDLVLVDCTDNFAQVVLPDPEANFDAVIGVKKIDGTTNRVEIYDSVRTLHQATLYYLRSGREYAYFQSDGEFWCPVQSLVGTERFYAETESETSNATTTMADAVSINDPDLSGGTYRIEWYAEMKVDNASTDIDVEIVEYDNDAAAVLTTYSALSYTPVASGAYFDTHSGYREVALTERRGTGLVTGDDIDFKFRFARKGGSGSVHVRRVRLKIERVS